MSESKRYKHDLLRQGNLATRPVEMYRKNNVDGTSLVLKSRKIEYNEFDMGDVGYTTNTPLYNDVFNLEYNPVLDFDFAKSNHIKNNLGW